jgi:hypothetical protein
MEEYTISVHFVLQNLNECLFLMLLTELVKSNNAVQTLFDEGCMNLQESISSWNFFKTFNSSSVFTSRQYVPLKLSGPYSTYTSKAP